MRRSLTSVWSMPFVLAFAIASAGGCESPAVGDPCEPEQIPLNGFVATESYLETSSVQCRTRVCMVYRLPGDPRADCVPDGQRRCATPQQVDECVYCTCRCDAPSDATQDTCECPDGFSCVPVLNSASAGRGIQGSYCVRTNATTCPPDFGDDN